MLTHYLTLAVRIFNRGRFYFLINVLGLGLGLAGSIMIFTYVIYENGYDKFHLKKDRIYRMTSYFRDQTQEEEMATTYPNLLFTFTGLFPEIETGVRLFDRSVLGGGDIIQVEDKNFINQKVYYADSTFFRVFTFPMIKGNETTALAGSGNAVLTSSAAKRYFGREDVINESFILNSGQSFRITGIMNDIPGQSHFHFGILLSMDSHPWVREANWNGIIFPTYLLLKEGASPDELTKKINQFLQKKFPDINETTNVMRLPLQKITDIHLLSAKKFELEANHDIRYIYIFSTIAVFLLAIAGINYINLETSRSVKRSKEVGIRKVFGAMRPNILFQLLGESVVTVIISFLVALLIINFALPFFNSVSGENFSFLKFFDKGKWIICILVALAIGIITGWYPALVISSQKPNAVFRGSPGGMLKGNTLRKILVVTQFSISMVLVIGTLVIGNQMKFIREKKLGIDKDHIIAIRMSTSEVNRNRESLKKELLNYHSIESISTAAQLPVNITMMEGITIENYSQESPEFYVMETDQDFFKTMGAELNYGKYFTSTYNKDLPEYMLNESAVRFLGMTPEEIIGRNITVRHGDMKPGPVIGIVKDFHFASLHNIIEPLVIWQYPGNIQYLLCRLAGNDIRGSVSFIEKKWKELTGFQADYKFLDQEYDNLYRQENRAGKLFSVFSIVTLFIAIVGLLGLSSFMAASRIKEVGIRKVLGSSTMGIAMMFIGDNLKSIAISLIIAVPAGFFLISHWLNEFAYKIKIGPGVILLAIFLVTAISAITVSIHALRAASANPVDTLRYE